MKINLPLEKTIFQVLRKEEKKIKEKVEEYLNWLKKEYPSTKESIEALWVSDDIREEWNQKSDETLQIEWLSFIREFTNDDDVVLKIKEDAGEKLKSLSAVNNLDNDISKDLKTEPINGLLNDLKLYYGGDVVFTVEFYQKFYLGELPKYIEKKLKEKTPNLTLKDLEQKDWNRIRQALFTNFYDSWENTAEEGEIEKLEHKLDKDIDDLDELIEKTRKSKKAPSCHIPEHKDLVEKADKLQKKVDAYDLEADKENSKKENNDLTKEEKAKIDSAKDKKELDEIITGIKDARNNINPQDLANANKWIAENISNKTKLEDLVTTEIDIDNNNQELNPAKLPPGFKDKVKQILRKKRDELTPEPATTEGKIKELLVWFQGRVSNLNKGIGGKTEIKVFEKYWKDKVDKIIPLVDKALKTDNLEGYKLLEKEWLNLKNQELNEKNENYSPQFDYFGVWNTLRDRLEEEVKETKYNDLVNKIKGELGPKQTEQFFKIWEFKVEVKKDK